MRTCFFIATKQGTGGSILESSSNLNIFQYADEEGNPVGKRRLLYNPQGTLDKDQMIELLIHRVASGIERAGSTWTVWELLPTSLDWRKGPRALRKLVRAKFGSEILGPFCKPEIERRDPELAAQIFPDGCLPHIIAGDDPVKLGQIDYAPTQQEADDDIEPSPEVILAITG